MKSRENNKLNLKKIGDKVKELRVNLGLSQSKFAVSLGYAENDNVKTIISQWERGKTLPPLEKLVEMSELCNVSIDTILCRTEYSHVENELIYEVTGLSDESIEVLRKNKESGNNQYLHILNLIVSDEELFNELMKNLCNLVSPPSVAITKELLGDNDYILLTQEDMERMSETPDKIFHNIRNLFQDFQKKNKDIKLIAPNQYHIPEEFYIPEEEREEDINYGKYQRTERKLSD